MKAQELRKLIREEVKKTLKEVTSYPINIAEIRPIGFNKAYIIVGNSSADMIGWEHDENDVKRIDPRFKYKPIYQKEIIINEDGEEEKLFKYYPDELYFEVDEFIGLTREQAFNLYRTRDIAYLRA